MEFYKQNDYCRTTPSNCIRVSKEGISLPTYVGLNREDILYVAEALIKSIQKFT
jgi:dTDP-4-amino-4,6-dideoxygalactose transaminase